MPLVACLRRRAWPRLCFRSSETAAQDGLGVFSPSRDGIEFHDQPSNVLGVTSASPHLDDALTFAALQRLTSEIGDQRRGVGRKKATSEYFASSWANTTAVHQA